MNAVLLYRNLDGALRSLTVRETFVEAAKAALRRQGAPAIAVIRPMARSTGNAWECDDYD